MARTLRSAAEEVGSASSNAVAGEEAAAFSSEGMAEVLSLVRELDQERSRIEDQLQDFARRIGGVA